MTTIAPALSGHIRAALLKAIDCTEGDLDDRDRAELAKVTDALLTVFADELVRLAHSIPTPEFRTTGYDAGHTDAVGWLHAAADGYRKAAQS